MCDHKKFQKIKVIHIIHLLNNFVVLIAINEHHRNPYQLLPHLPKKTMAVFQRYQYGTYFRNSCRWKIIT